MCPYFVNGMCKVYEGNRSRWQTFINSVSSGHVERYCKHPTDWETGCVNVDRIERKGAFSNSSGGRSSGGCYVATCVYGTYNCPEVWTLRRFRDNTLSRNKFGRCFIRLYYAVSPKLIKTFGKKAWFGRLFKPPVDSLVLKLRNQGVDNSHYTDKD